MNKEPLLTTGSLTAIVAAFLVFMQQMGVPISDAQQDAIRNLVAVLAPFILALIARQFVFSPNTVQNKVDQAYSATPGVDPKPKVE